MSKYYAIKDSKVKHSEYDRINEDLYLKIDNFCSLVNESALSNYKKIYIVTALRTTYGNKVLLYPDGKPYKVTDLQFPDNSVAKLYDLCLLSSKYALQVP
jgi:hypothetical protein